MEIDFLSVECLEKLGLDQNPFIDHARDPFLFMDAQHEMSMNVIIDYLSNQNSTLVLLGEVGIGKTTHLRMLLRKGYQSFNFCTLRAKPKTTFSDIECKVIDRWRLPQEPQEEIKLLGADNENALTTDEHIKKYIEDDKNPVLIIDDAHRLGNDVLDQVLKLKHHVGLQSKNSLGLVLAAEPNIQTKLSELEHINPAATQIYQINVRSFDSKQCEDYLNYRLEQAGSTSEDIFSTDKIADIVKRSNGLPKLINKLAREELTRQCEQGIAVNNGAKNLHSSPSMRLGLILAGLIGLIVLVSALLNNSHDLENNIELDLTKKSTEQQDAQTTNSVNDVELNNMEVQKLEEPKNKKQQEVKVIKKPYVAPLVLGPLLDRTSIDKPENNKNEKAEEKLKILTNKNNKAIDSNNPTKNDGRVLSSEWIMRQNPNEYTIQIVASPKEQNLHEFINKNALTENTAFYKKSSSGKDWFVLVHGVYPTRGAALEGIQQLSDSIKKNSPYPIQIKFLHEIIQKQ